MSTDLFRALSNDQANADLSSYFNSLGHVPEEQMKLYKEQYEAAQKDNELTDTLVDAAAAPFVEHGVGGGVNEIVRRLKGRLSAKAQELAKNALVDKGVDEDLADRLVKGKIKPSELYEQMKRRGGEKFENLRAQFGKQVEETAGRAEGALNDARQAVQDTADQAAATARDAADQAAQAGNAAADQLANQAGDIADAARGRVADLSDNPLHGANVSADGAPPPEAAPGDGMQGGAQLRADHDAFQAARDAHEAEGRRLAQNLEDANAEFIDASKEHAAAQKAFLEAPEDQSVEAELDQMDRFKQATSDFSQKTQALEDAKRALDDHRNAPGPQEANPPSAQDVDPSQDAANRAAAARQNQDVNPGQDVDGHGDEGEGSNIRRTTGDDDNVADPGDPTAPAGETAGVDTTADETIAGVSDAVDAAAAGEGFLDPAADFAALALGLGLMGGIGAAKKQMPKAPTPVVAINPAGGIGL